MDDHSLLQLPYTERRTTRGPLARDNDVASGPQLPRARRRRDGRQRAARPGGHRRQAPNPAYRPGSGRRTGARSNTRGCRRSSSPDGGPGQGHGGSDRTSSAFPTTTATYFTSAASVPASRPDARRSRQVHVAAAAGRQSLPDSAPPSGDPRRRLGPPRPRRRGRLHRVDLRRPPAPPLLARAPTRQRSATGPPGGVALDATYGGVLMWVRSVPGPDRGALPAGDRGPGHDAVLAAEIVAPRPGKPWREKPNAGGERRRGAVCGKRHARIEAVGAGNGTTCESSPRQSPTLSSGFG